MIYRKNIVCKLGIYSSLEIYFKDIFSERFNPYHQESYFLKQLRLFYIDILVDNIASIMFGSSPCQEKEFQGSPQ